jgi:hypothetical protein
MADKQDDDRPAGAHDLMLPQSGLGELVHDHPLTAVLTAFLIGALLAKFAF